MVNDPRAAAEMLLWRHLSTAQHGMSFRRRVVQGVYRLDFVCAAQGLAVLIENDQCRDANEQEARQRRDAWLVSRGFRLQSWTPAQILADVDRVLAGIYGRAGGDAANVVVPPAVQRDAESEMSAVVAESPQVRAADEEFMRRAVVLAQRAATAGEVPVGAVLVKEGAIVAEGWNCPIHTHDPSAHAEIVTLRAAGEALQNYRLPGTTLYVTLEPCVMCAGAIMHARVDRLVFGARDPKAGAVDSVYDVISNSRLNHRLEWIGGVLAPTCGELLRDFFKQRRSAGGAERQAE